MILCFELSMPHRGSWNNRWSGQDDVHVITKTDRAIGRKRVTELDGKAFCYDFGDGWTAMVSCRIVSAKEASSLRKRNRGFCGYDWMVRSIIAEDRIEKAYARMYG